MQILTQKKKDFLQKQLKYKTKFWFEIILDSQTK